MTMIMQQDTLDFVLTVMTYWITIVNYNIWDDCLLDGSRVQDDDDDDDSDDDGHVDFGDFYVRVTADDHVIVMIVMME